MHSGQLSKIYIADAVFVRSILQDKQRGGRVFGKLKDVRQSSGKGACSRIMKNAELETLLSFGIGNVY